VIKKDKMGGACRTYGINNKFILNLLENLNARDHSHDLGVDREIILEKITKFYMRIWTGFIWLKM
jgi:hypothetical protein